MSGLKMPDRYTDMEYTDMESDGSGNSRWTKADTLTVLQWTGLITLGAIDVFATVKFGIPMIGKCVRQIGDHMADGPPPDNLPRIDEQAEFDNIGFRIGMMQSEFDVLREQVNRYNNGDTSFRNLIKLNMNHQYTNGHDTDALRALQPELYDEMSNDLTDMEHSFRRRQLDQMEQYLQNR